MKQLSISDEMAKKLYTTADASLKIVLEETYGKGFFSQKITDRVKSFEDACDVLGIDDEDVYSPADESDERAYKKLKVIARALNEGWQPDWSNDNQQKWFPWFYMDRFRLDSVGYYCSASDVGSRLCFRTSELAEYAAKQFTDLYKNYLTL